MRSLDHPALSVPVSHCIRDLSAQINPTFTIEARPHGYDGLRMSKMGWEVLLSLEIRANEVDEVLGQFRGDLLRGTVGEMEADVGFEHLAHEGVDAAAHGGKQHQLVAAISVAGEGA